MILNDAALYEKMVDLQKSSIKPVHWKWEAEIFIDEKLLKVHNLFLIERVSDYAKQNTEILVVGIQVEQSLYQKSILPNKDNLKLKLTKSSTDKTSQANIVGESYSQTFLAFLTDPTSITLMAKTGDKRDDPVNDVGGFLTLYIQLVDPAFYEFRLIESGGIYRSLRTDTLLQGMMTQEIHAINGDTTGVDIIPGQNEEEYFHIVVPNGMRLIDLPKYVQETYGVYSSGIGYFLYKGIWYIYPLLDYTRFNKTSRNLTLLAVPKDEMMGSDNSYVVDGDQLFVFATGEVTHTDRSEHTLNNQGNGFRYSINRNLLDKFRDHKAGVSTVPKGRNMVEVIVEERPVGYNNLKTIDGFFTDNPWNDMAKATAGLSSIITMKWDSSDPDLLYPGMPVKILYKSDGQVRSLYATLIAAKTRSRTEKKSVADNRYVSSTELTLYAQREIIKE